MNKNFQITILGLNPNHYNIIRNLIDISSSVHVFAKPNIISHSKLPFQIHNHFLDDNLHNLDQIQTVANKLSGTKVIIPATDSELIFLNKHRLELEQDFLLCLPQPDCLEIVSNKFLIQEALKKHDINYPSSVMITDQQTLASSCYSLRFPCIIKPVYSNEWKTTESSKILGENKALIVNNWRELSAAYENVQSISSQVIAQEIIPQKGYENYSFCSYSDKNGNVLHGFVTQKLLQYPDRFGTAILCQTVDNPRIAEYGTRVINALGLDGIAETEIIVDAETDELYVIEVNPRHWMQHRLATSLGVNYTLLDIYYRLGLHEQVQACLNAEKTSKHAIWIDDVGYLIYVIKHLLKPEKCFFKQLFFKRREYSLFSLKDWKPFWYTLNSKFRNT